MLISHLIKKSFHGKKYAVLFGKRIAPHYNYMLIIYFIFVGNYNRNITLEGMISIRLMAVKCTLLCNIAQNKYSIILWYEVFNTVGV